MKENISDYIKKNQEQIFDKLFSLLRIPSISAKKDHKNDMLQCANRWKELLMEAGVDKAEIMETAGNPVVYAEKLIDTTLPTIMIYGHYDVMPPEPMELWETEPFQPQIIDGYIKGRGADDDKGQSFMHYIAFCYLNSTQQLSCNIKFLLEGEEEIGSPSLEAFCQTHKDLLKCDNILVSDTSMLAADMPSITTGLRGLAYWQLEVSAANRDLHSGIFGGAVANPINELCKIIAQLQDNNGRVLVPHFYDDVEEVSAEERKLIQQIPFDEKTYKENIGIKETHGEIGYSTIERTGIRPSFDVCGIWGGYTGEGAKTVLPSVAYAKLSTRLVPHQTYEKIASLMVEYVKSIAPSYVNVNIYPLHGAESYVCPITLPAYKAAEAAYTRTFGKRPLPVRRGGSIGVIAIFEKVLGVKSILLGVGLDSDAIHSPNENYPIEMFFNGIKTIVAFYEELEKVKP